MVMTTILIMMHEADGDNDTDSQIARVGVPPLSSRCAAATDRLTPMSATSGIIG